MRRVLLRKTSAAELTPEQAEQLVRACPGGNVIQRDGLNLLIDLDPCEIATLRERLKGWIVSEQGPNIPVPDTCVRIKS
ncbi:MAG: hypothetical protein V4754_19440 [Pseudomonadota bacterium]